MTLVTARPDATGTTSGTSAVGAASRHAATSDDSDSSYVTGGFTQFVRFGLNEPTLPAGAVPKTLALRARLAKTASAGGATVLAQLWAQIDGESITELVSTIVVSWLSPTTITVNSRAIDAWPTTALVVSFDQTSGGTDWLRLYEVFVDLTYVAQPEVAVAAPSGTVSDTNMPDVSWVNTLDSDGGAQVAHEVKVFTEAQFTAGGFDPATSTPFWTPGVIGVPLEMHPVETPLPDGNYRAYVRAAQLVDVTLHWSDWEYSEFTVDVALPATPLLVVTPQTDTGSFSLDVDLDEDPGTSTDRIELQRSIDGGSTWVGLRTIESDDGRLEISPLDEDKQLEDWEAPILTSVYYRVRAHHDYSGVYAASDWCEPVAATLNSRQWWLKDPLLPSRNLAVEIDSYPSVQRPARAGIFQALGATTQIVVSDTRQAARGTVTFRVDTTEAYQELLELLETDATFLLHGPGTNHEPDRYVRLTDIDSGRLVDKGFVEGRKITVPWYQVAKPTGPLQEGA